MKSLKQIISRNLSRLTLAMMVFILLIAVGLQILIAQGQARENAGVAFQQIGQLLQQNERELEKVKAEYRKTCLLNAETIAYIIQNNPEILGNVQEFREVAYKLQVDEIHIFDDSGRIFDGSHPEYYDMTFDSGEQISFFKPMMADKSLSLCQDITPNTAEGKLVQYSARWSPDGRFIVQVGMYPEAVLEATEKNELSYIFSLLQGNPGVALYAIDPNSGIVIGSSSGDTGKDMGQVGFSIDRLRHYQNGTHEKVNGVNCFCVFEDAEGTLVGYVISNDQLYGNIFWYTGVLTVCMVLIALVLVRLMNRLTSQYIVGSVARINEKLRFIGSGKLDESVNERSSQEFAELSDHISQMVQNLLADTDKMSFVLNLSNLRIGVYEYNTGMKSARFTEHVPAIFGLNQEEMRALAADQSRLKSFIERLRQDPVPQRENTYRYVGKGERFLTLEEVSKGSDILGVVMDVTEEIRSFQQAEAERDIDLLTGLYNRRGMMSHMERLFTAESERGYGAVVVVDADGLKQVNDSYGHLIGDAYLKRMAEQFQNFGAPQQFCGRIGGDEFLLMLYGYKSENEVLDALSRLRFQQKNTVLHLDDGSELPLRFSFGYVLIQGREDYHSMISEADAYMYNVKRLRKQAQQSSIRGSSLT